MGRPTESVRLLQTALETQPNNPALYMHLGDTLNNLKQWDMAIDTYHLALDVSPDHPLLRTALGDVLQNKKRMAEAMEQYDAALKVAPDHPPLIVSRAMAARRLCDWQSFESDTHNVFRVSRQELKAGQPCSLSPYHAMGLTVDHPSFRPALSASWQRKYAEQARRLQWSPAPPPPRPSPAAVGVVLGYISRRFEQYPGTQLLQRVFGLHAASSHVVCFATGADDGSAERATVKDGCDTFLDLSMDAAPAMAQAVVDHRVDVLLDYDGLHDFNNMVALGLLRMAGVNATIVSFLGMAATTRSAKHGFHSHVVVDPVIAPVESAPAWFGEKLLVLQSSSYQPQDPQELFDMADMPDVVRALHLGEPLAAGVPSWAEWKTALNQPTDQVVLACFNRAEKYDPTTFRMWLEVMQRVPTTVLWLYVPAAPETQDSLVALAASAGVHPSRLTFVDRLPKPQHLARHYHADLFLDTFEYGAHTTATDALSTGLPVLTMPGQSMASRVATGLVQHTRISDVAEVLVAQSRKEFVDTAVRLASRPAVLAGLRRKLVNELFPGGSRAVRPEAKDRSKPCALFDVRCFTRRLDVAVAAVREADIIGRRRPFHVVAGTRNRPGLTMD